MKDHLDDLLNLAQSGDTKTLGAKIVALQSLDLEHLKALTQILLKGNWEKGKHNDTKFQQKTFLRASLAAIEALFQRGAATELAKLAFLSWRSFDESPLSIRCLDAAVDLKQLDALYDLAHDMHSNGKPSVRECAANLILKLAKAGYKDAFFITGEFFRDGLGLRKDRTLAKEWFLKAAIFGSVLASTELGVVPDALRELAKREKDQQSKDFYLHQADVVEKAKKSLSALLPGDETEALIDGDESGEVEFKEMAKADDSRILRTTAAFLNSSGGNLFIGINSERHALGLRKSYEELNVANRDLFERHLNQRFRSNLKSLYPLDISFSYPTFHGHEICKIRIRPSEFPIFLTEDKKRTLYIRTGNANCPLN
jgi:TPR repeat protein